MSFCRSRTNREGRSWSNAALPPPPPHPTSTCRCPLLPIDRVIFCVFLDTDYKIYKEKMSRFFPQDEDVDEEAAEGLPEEVQKDTPPSKKPKSKKRGGADDDDSEEEEEEEQPAGDVTMESQTEAAAGEEDGAEVPAQGDGDEEMSQEELERKKEVAEQETSPDKLDGSEPVGAVPEDEEMDWSAAGGSQSSLGTGQPEASPQPMNSVPKAESAGTERDVPGDGGSQAPARQEKPEGDEGVGAAGEGDATQSAEATASGDVTGPAEGPPSESRNLSGDPAEAEVIQPDSNQSKERAGDLEQP
ncbi:O-acetyl-ADP-ribose deacetylase MACROD2-like isoform X3 [Arapaima gigas]